MTVLNPSELQTPTVSIVLPTYNRARTLNRSISSVLRQSYPDFELIVVDDGSSDNTAEVVSAFHDSRIHYIRRETNGGVAAARNTGVRAARGRYLAFQDSDDEWLLDKLQMQISDLSPLKETAMSICGLVRLGRHSDSKATWLLTYPRSAPEWQFDLDQRRVLASEVSYTQCWLVPRKAVLDAGGFDERLSIWDDWDLLIRLSMRLLLRTRPDPLVVSERLEDSLSQDISRFIRDMTLILDKYAGELSQWPKDHAALMYSHAVRLCKTGRVLEAKKVLIKALQLAPFSWRIWRLMLRTLLGKNHVARRFHRHTLRTKR